MRTSCGIALGHMSATRSEITSNSQEYFGVPVTLSVRGRFALGAAEGGEQPGRTPAWQVMTYCSVQKHRVSKRLAI